MTQKHLKRYLLYGFVGYLCVANGCELPELKNDTHAQKYDI